MDASDTLQTNVATPSVAPVKPLAIRTDERFTITTPDGLVTDTGFRELRDYMMAQNLGDLPPDFEPVWLTKRGTLPKRIAAHVYKSAGLKLTSEQVGEIGNIAKRNTSTAQTYRCDFTKRIDWNCGEFGDYGSCAWGDKAGMKLMVEDNGFAVRFYRESGSGYARAWVAPISDNRLIVFNAYGETPIAVARVLSVHFACGYKRINLTNRGSDSGMLWINGGSAYILGAWGKIADVASWSLDWEEIEAEEKSSYCAVCDGDMGHEDNVEDFAYNRYSETVPCCEDCSFECEQCNERFTEDCQRRLEGNSYCRGCHDEIVEEKAQERAEEIERLTKKKEDLETIIEDLQSQIEDTREDLEKVESQIEDLEAE